MQTTSLQQNHRPRDRHVNVPSAPSCSVDYRQYQRERSLSYMEKLLGEG